jgi:hypothetical protein
LIIRCWKNLMLVKWFVTADYFSNFGIGGSESPWTCDS